MSEELSGRALDRAIAEALGWEYPHQGKSGPYRIGPFDSFEFIPEFHSSVDALREVEPDGVELGLDRVSSDCWEARYWVNTGPLSQSMAVEETGTTEPEARARALLAWLRRDEG